MTLCSVRGAGLSAGWVVSQTTSSCPLRSSSMPSLSEVRRRRRLLPLRACLTAFQLVLHLLFLPADLCILGHTGVLTPPQMQLSFLASLTLSARHHGLPADMLAKLRCLIPASGDISPVEANVLALLRREHGASATAEPATAAPMTSSPAVAFPPRVLRAFSVQPVAFAAPLIDMLPPSWTAHVASVALDALFPALVVRTTLSRPRTVLPDALST
jgi:hypothetical protein